MPYTEKFREQDLKKVFEAIIDGDSVSIVGIGTIGKTLIVTHFADDTRVQQYLLGLCNSGYSSEYLLFLRFDANALLDIRNTAQHLPAAWPAYELLLHRLARTLRETQSRLAQRYAQSVALQFETLTAQIEQYYSIIQDHTGLGPHMAYRLVEEAISQVYQTYKTIFNACRIILIFDEFERLLKHMPVSFFLNLRALRDQFRYKLAYITATRQPVEELVDRIKPGKRLAMEPFSELFRNTLYIGPNLNDNDREEMLAQLVRRKKDPNWIWPPGLKERLLYITGGHSGLTRTCFSSEILEHVQRANSHEAAIGRLLHEESINRELRNILESFSEEEQQLLESIAAGMPLSPDIPTQIIVRSLERKYAIQRAYGGGLQVFPPLLYYFLGNSAQRPYPNLPNQPYSVPT